MRERGDTMSPRSSIWGMGILRSKKCKNKPTANIVSNGPERCAKDLEWAPSADIENAKTNPLAIELHQLKMTKRSQIPQQIQGILHLASMKNACSGKADLSNF
jgi:hypothetical protein